MPFGTIIVDPPWDYGKTTKSIKDAGRSRRGTDGKEYYISGYSSDEYTPLTTSELCALPVGELAGDDSVLLLWATMPLIGDALKLIEAWNFRYVTSLAWVKIQDHPHQDTPDEKEFELSYGVGYWFRGAAELIMVGRRGKAYRTNYAGLLGKRFRHSRKPDDLYTLAENSFPGPYLELFARRPREGWTQVGNELPGHEGEDVREGLSRLNAERPECPETLRPQLTEASHEEAYS